MNESTSEILKRLAPDFAAPGASDYYFTEKAVHNFVNGNWEGYEYQGVLDSYAQALVRVEKARTGLARIQKTYENYDPGDKGEFQDGFDAGLRHAAEAALSALKEIGED